MNNTIIFGIGLELVGIKEFLKRFVIVREAGPRLYLKLTMLTTCALDVT